MPEPSPEKIRPVWLASYPRSGNTYLRIILERKFQLPTYSRYRVEGQNHDDPSADALDQAPYLPRDWRQRLDPTSGSLTVIKTHDLPEDEAPAIYIVREGPAAVDSYFHYHKKFAFEQPSLTEVIAGACQFGRWGDHYLGWRPQTRPKTLFIRYEQLVEQPEAVIPRIGEFLGLVPSEGQLPAFSELREKLPAFFRRGRNHDFLQAWTPAQLALFSALNGAAMRELGYAEPPFAEKTGESAFELAASAARLHNLYVQELHNQGLCLAAREQLSAEVRQLQDRLDELSLQLAREVAKRERVEKQLLMPLLQNRWVKLGMTLRAVPRASGDGDGNSSLLN